MVVGFSEAKARCGCEMTRDCVRLCPEMMWMEQQFGDGETSNVLREAAVNNQTVVLKYRAHSHTLA